LIYSFNPKAAQNVLLFAKRHLSFTGVIEAGLFTKHSNVYYKAKDDGSFDAIKS
jgi:hypothetical protein